MLSLETRSIFLPLFFTLKYYGNTDHKKDHNFPCKPVIVRLLLWIFHIQFVFVEVVTCLAYKEREVKFIRKSFAIWFISWRCPSFPWHLVWWHGPHEDPTIPTVCIPCIPSLFRHLNSVCPNLILDRIWLGQTDPIRPIRRIISLEKYSWNFCTVFIIQVF